MKKIFTLLMMSMLLVSCDMGKAPDMSKLFTNLDKGASCDASCQENFYIYMKLQYGEGWEASCDQSCLNAELEYFMAGIASGEITFEEGPSGAEEAETVSDEKSQADTGDETGSATKNTNDMLDPAISSNADDTNLINKLNFIPELLVVFRGRGDPYLASIKSLTSWDAKVAAMPATLNDPKFLSALASMLKDSGKVVVGIKGNENHTEYESFMAIAEGEPSADLIKSIKQNHKIRGPLVQNTIKFANDMGFADLDGTYVVGYPFDRVSNKASKTPDVISIDDTKFKACLDKYADQDPKALLIGTGTPGAKSGKIESVIDFNASREHLDNCWVKKY